MAQPRKIRIRKHLLSAAAATGVILALVALLPAATRPEVVAVASPVVPETPSAAPLRPSYVVRLAPPAPALPLAEHTERVSLTTEPPPAPEPEAEAELWYVTAGALNLRAGPSSASAQLAALPMGTAVAIAATDGKWVEVTAEDGMTGWVFAKYLSRTAPQ